MSAFTERELIQDKKKKRRKEKKAEFWPVRSNTGLSWKQCHGLSSYFLADRREFFCAFELVVQENLRSNPQPVFQNLLMLLLSIQVTFHSWTDEDTKWAQKATSAEIQFKTRDHDVR